MNKNLKKVISAVAALALSASSFVALAATDYPDVDASASYKQAVDELSALNVINGYEDGTFQPDKLVTRAEFSKMVITALGSAELAQAESAAGQNTQFTDVTGSHWAAGYVTAAVSNSIINGMGDGTFAPEANITYAQAMKMLVCAAGYEQYSMDKGGWPNGYLYWGNQLKVGAGVKDVTDTTEITRAQCAQMIDNVINVPVCVETGEYNYDIYGKQYPKLSMKDGDGRDFQSILTKKHDAYKVKGMVVETQRSGDKKADEVSFQIMTARNWSDESDPVKKSDNMDPITAKIGNSEADKFIHKYVEAIIQENEDEEFEILSIFVTGQNTETVVAASDVDEDTEFDKARLYVLKNGKSSNHKISAGEDGDAKMFVNGVSVGNFTEANYNKYIIGNEVGDITLIDVPGESNTTDGKADYVMVDYYLTAVVDSVNAADEEDIQISFVSADGGFPNPWIIDLTDEDYVYSFKVDGNEIGVDELEQYDVLSVQADPIDPYRSTFFDVLVSKASNAIEGKVSAKDVAEDEYTVNGTVYKTAIDGLVLNTGDSYTMYVDAFGRIAYLDELASEKKIAIIDSAYDNVAGDGTMAKLILADGTSVEYELRDVDSPIDKNVKNAVQAKKIVYENGEKGTKNPVEDRVVEYSLNASSELTIKSILAPAGGADLEYKASQGRIGKYMIDVDTTAFIYADPNDIKEITAMNASTLTDGNTYEAYVYDRSNSTSIYRFAIIKTGAGQMRADTSIAIVKKAVQTSDDGDTVNALEVMINGEDATILLDDAVKAEADVIDNNNNVLLSEGDAIMYATNASGYVTEIIKLTTGLDMSAYANIFAAAFAGTELDEDIVDAVEALPKVNKDDTASLVFGPIVDSKTGSVTIAKIETDANGNVVSDKTAEIYNYAANYNTYTINYNYSKGSRISDANSVSGITVGTAVYVDTNRDYFYWGKLTEATNPRFAIAKTVDGDITDIYVIVPKTTEKIDKSDMYTEAE